LRKNKEKEIFIQVEISSQSSARSKRNLTKSFQNLAESSQNFAGSFQNFTESFENISLSERARDEISEIILQKLRNRHSKIFTNHKESSHFIISFSSSEVEMTKQQQQNRSNQNIQDMIQAIIRDMMSEIIQQSVAAVVNVTAATAATRSNSLSASDHSQMISRATSESRIDR
jgi:predicted house-cleaning noncanonical NTP pyrophosphatase (MazG superfamily)